MTNERRNTHTTWENDVPFDKLYSPYNGSIIKIVKKLN